MFSGGRYLIYETGAQGLVVAAMLERVGGKLIEIEDTDRVSLGKNIHLRLWFYKFDFETLINKIQGFPNGKNRKHDVFLEMYFGIHYSVEILYLQVWFWKISFNMGFTFLVLLILPEILRFMFRFRFIEENQTWLN